MTGEPVPYDPTTEEAHAIERIARTTDGALLHRYLRRILETVYDTPDPGALQSHNGRRTLARDLMRQMAEGIEAARGGRPDPGNDSILTRSGKPVDFRARRGSDRRVALKPGDGWGPDRGTDGGGK